MSNEKTLFAIFINAVDRNISLVEIPDPKVAGYDATNKAIYALLGEGTGMMEIAVRLEKQDVVFVDEEGLFNAKTGAFSYNGSHPFMGNGLICGGDGMGGTDDAKVSFDKVVNAVRFFAVRERE